MENLATVLTKAFEVYPNLERVVLYVHRVVKLKEPIGSLTTKFISIDAHLNFNVQTFESLTEYINPMLYTFPVKEFYTDKHEESIYITIQHLVGEE